MFLICFGLAVCVKAHPMTHMGIKIGIKNSTIIFRSFEGWVSFGICVPFSL